MRTFKDYSEEEQSELVSHFYDRFSGRLETYALRVEFGGDRGAAYLPSNHEKAQRQVQDIGTAEFTEAVVRAHLEGRYLIGAYPIQADNKVQWFALDFDGKNGDPYKEALEQATTFVLEAGLKVYVERSQSGNGYHVWGFLDQPVEAHKLRHAIKRFIENTDTYDRMFPNQDNISDTRPLGNLIALPFSGMRQPNGNSTFVVRQGGGDPKPVDMLTFMREIKSIPAAKIEELFEQAGKYEPQREHTVFEGNAEGMPDGYKVNHPVFGCEFIRWCYDNPSEVTEPLWYAAACNLAQLEDGRRIFHEMSSQDASRYDYAATEKKYDQAVRQNKPHSCEVIRDLGGLCVCDQRFPGKVYHPFELAKLPLATLLDSVVLDDEQTTESIAEGMDSVIDWLYQVQEDPTIGRGLPTGVRSLDRHFGYRMGEITVDAARNSIGKTAWDLQQALHLSMDQGIPTKFFSLEMTARQLWTRALSPITEVTQTRMATGQLTASDWAKIKQAKEDVKGVPFFVDDTTAHLDSIIESAGRFVGKHAKDGKAVIFVDYLQIIPRLPKENEQDQIARSIQALKRLAKILNIHVVVLCQLNRGAEDATNDSRTSDAWLRGSGVIEFVADNIRIILGEKGPGIVQRTMTIHKQRNGEAGIRIDLHFNQPLMLFGDEGAWGMLQQATADTSTSPRVDSETTGDAFSAMLEAAEQQQANTAAEDLFAGME